MGSVPEIKIDRIGLVGWLLLLLLLLLLLGIIIIIIIATVCMVK